MPIIHRNQEVKYAEVLCAQHRMNVGDSETRCHIKEYIEIFQPEIEKVISDEDKIICDGRDYDY